MYTIQTKPGGAILISDKVEGKEGITRDEEYQVVIKI